MGELAFRGPNLIRGYWNKPEATAKTIMEKANVPLVPGYHGDEQGAEFLAKEADRIGYPVLIKASAGGGGKGDGSKGGDNGGADGWAYGRARGRAHAADATYTRYAVDAAPSTRVIPRSHDKRRARALRERTKEPRLLRAFQL